jgi:hypothetical protein
MHQAQNHPTERPAARAPGLRLPDVLTPPELEMTEWGGRLPKQRYFPLYMGNGRDAMLINIMGAGDGHWERPIRSANPLSRLLNNGWYRADRRAFADSDLVYGQLVPFVEFSAGPLMRGEQVVPRELRQYFDPRTATLTTFFGQQDNRTEQWLRYRSQTWLTAEGLLVQTVTFLEVPECGVQFLFTMGEPSPDYQNAKVPFVRPDDAEFLPERGGQLIRYRSRWEQGTAAGFSLLGGASVDRVREITYTRPASREVEQITALCGVGETVWRILSVQDTKEGENAAGLCQKALERIEQLGIGGLREAHCEEWAAYFDTCEVNLPDPTAQYLYEVSRYVIKANLHPCGFLPMGNLPSHWQGAMFWDASFGHQALAGCGNLTEAASIGNHFLSLEDAGRKRAASFGSPGIRIEWTVNLFDFSKYNPPCRQIHNNAVWAHCFFVLADHEAKRLDARTLAFVRDLLVFLVDQLLPEEGQVDPLIGIDESYSDPKPNDTWSIAVTLKALEDYEAYCRSHDLPTQIPRLTEAITHLRRLLAGNVDADGILQSFTGGKVPHWGSLVFDLFPDSEAALPTLAKMSQYYCPEFHLFNFHGLNRYAERAFPWANNWVARSLARMGRPEALHYWLNNTRSTNAFGGVPERVFYHGENYIDWCMTGHASQVWAMNAMLADFRNDSLTLLGGIDPGLWHTLSFKNLHSGGGLTVSLVLEAGTLHSLRINNLSEDSRRVTIVAPHHQFCDTVLLAPGENEIIVPGNQGR